MTVRMDNVLVVVRDMERAKAFFNALGLELVGETSVQGPWVDAVVGLQGVHADIALMRAPDGSGQIELTRYHAPEAVEGAASAPANALGIRRIMFEVEDVRAMMDRLLPLGATLVGAIADYEDAYRLCFVRGPEDIMIGLAQPLQQN